MQLKQLCDFCDEYLKVDDFNDYCPNGLQVEANPVVEHIVCGVTASQALIEAAIDAGADTLIVHHGYFWKGESQPITGIKGSAYRQPDPQQHQPAGFSPAAGCACRGWQQRAAGAKIMDWQVSGSGGEQGLLFEGALPQAAEPSMNWRKVDSPGSIRALAIDGGGHAYRAHRLVYRGGTGFHRGRRRMLGVDAFVSGEVSEPTFHAARELGIHYIAAGHHATERYGVQALARK